MKTLLLYPPITDPTSGYHSLTYIETYARQQGFEEIDIVDTNLEGLLYSMTPSQIDGIKTHILNRYTELEKKDSLTAMEQLELFYLWKVQDFDYDNLIQSLEVMRDSELFYDYSQYRPAAEFLLAWLDVLSVFGYPGQFSGYSLPIRYTFNLSSTIDMSNHKITSKIAAPFEPYFRDVLLPMIEEKGYKTIGINITYCAQLPFALAISRMIRATFPDMILLFGGTEVSDVWKYLTDKTRFFDVFDVADACVIGEGEVAFTRLLGMIEKDYPFEPIHNVLFHTKYDLSTIEPQIEFGKIFDLPTPDYSKLPLNLYLSPHPYVYYSPSRGCYWNKCTFCDYGLNFDSPTSPWRQNPLDKIVEDLKQITSHSIKHVYFSVDVLAPAMLLNLAEKLVEENLEIRWGAEIRLEKYWSPERCALLKTSGCTDISVGYESGNQRILDLIDKGTQVPRVKETIHNFSGAGIGVQMMGFTGFPTETYAEALESVHFLQENRPYWTFGGLGTFTLTPGSIVAKNPERFQIEKVSSLENEDIARDLYFENPIANLTDDDLTHLEQEKKTLSINHFGRPWVGGVDTAHTMFYHEKYGLRVTDMIRSDSDDVDPEKVWYLNGAIATDPNGYSVPQLLTDRAILDLQAQSRKQVKGLTASMVERIFGQSILERLAPLERSRYFVRIDGRMFPFPDAMLDFLALFLHGFSLNRVLAVVNESDHEGYVQLFRHCVQHNFLRQHKRLGTPVFQRELSKKWVEPNAHTLP